MSSPPAPKLVDWQGNPLREVRLASIEDVIKNLPIDNTICLLFSENQNSWYICKNRVATLYDEKMVLPYRILPADLFSGGGGGGGGGLAAVQAAVPATVLPTVPVAASSAPAPTSSLSSVPHGFKMRRRTPAPTRSVPAPMSSVPAPMSSVPAHGSVSAPMFVITDDSGSMQLNRETTVAAVCGLVGRQDPNTKITIMGFDKWYNPLRIQGSSATVGDEFRRVYNPSGGTPLYSTLVSTIRSFGSDEEIIIVAFTDGEDTDSRGLTAASVKAALAERPNVVFWFMASTRDAEAVGTAMGAHSVLPYSDQHIGAALEAVHESQQVYRQTGTPGVYKQRHRDAAMGRA